MGYGDTAAVTSSTVQIFGHAVRAEWHLRTDQVLFLRTFDKERLMPSLRRLPVGAEQLAKEGIDFRVWAPRRKHVEVVLEGDAPVIAPLKSAGDGYFSGVVPQARVGSRYRYRLDGGDAFPDPASRFQPEGPHGPSEVVDPSGFAWSDQQWPGVRLAGQAIYEMHIGTFTLAGTWQAAAEQLPFLAELGITLLEVMPVAAFPGKFGWGYDGVHMYAPSQLYGTPDDFRSFVDRAHRLGLGVILDVVYNHFGPAGNYTGQFSDYYVSRRYKNEWGDPINFDDEHAEPVRDYFASNAAYWIEEFHLDGLRLDATQQIFDASPENILAVINRRARAAAGNRSIVLIAENEPQMAQLVRSPAQGGYGLDGIWNDDFHHSAHVALTAANEAYFTDYLGQPQEFISAAKWGFLFQGQRYSWQQKRRGTPAFDLLPEQFINFLENHDQVSNSAHGKRLCYLASPGKFRAMTALLLLSPGTPLLFQGQEFACSNPFLFFADHEPELARLVARGRAEFLCQFPSIAVPEIQAALADPADPATFERCKLDLGQRERNEAIVRLHRDLLRLRSTDPVFASPRLRGCDGAVLGAQAFALRYFAADGADRLLLVNLGSNLHLDPAPEPLLAPPADRQWQVAWSSEMLAYGGAGAPPVETDDNWRIPGEATVVLVPVVAPPESNAARTTNDGE